MTRWGGFLDDLELFDAAFFGISPREAASLDPSQRLLLETAWEACEDAAIDPRALAGQPVGVFVGQWLSDFESRLFADTDELDFYATTGSGRYATSGRLSVRLRHHRAAASPSTPRARRRSWPCTSPARACAAASRAWPSPPAST